MGNLLDLCFWPVAVLARPATGLPSGPPIHHMLLLHNGLVFHNTPEQGEHLDLLDASLQGLPAWRWYIASEHQVAAHVRLIEALENPRPYHGTLNNCQHTVSRIVTGVAQSPTLRLAGLCVGIAGFIGFACQIDRRTRLRK